MTAASKQKRRDERRVRVSERLRSRDLAPDTQAEAFRTIADAVEHGTPIELTGKSSDEKRTILARTLRRT